MLDYAIWLESQYNAAETTTFARQTNIATIALEIGSATGLGEHQVHRRLAAAERVRGQAPQTWLAFEDGRLDAARATVISDAIEKLKREQSVVRLDQRVFRYAESHTLTELRRWLNRFIARVEADLAAERADDERTRRGVHVEHGDDGMSWLSAYLPAFQAAAIGKRLTKHVAAAIRPGKTRRTNRPLPTSRRGVTSRAPLGAAHRPGATTLISRGFAFNLRT